MKIIWIIRYSDGTMSCIYGTYTDAQKKAEAEAAGRTYEIIE